MKARIVIQHEPFDLGREVGDLSREGVGAIATFTGHVRAEEGLETLILEHYPGMTEREIARHAEEAARRWTLLGITVIHRVGELKPGDPIVLVAVAAAHRGDAFAACEFLMDQVKTQATFWKQQSRGGETVWLGPKPADDKRAERWK